LTGEIEPNLLRMLVKPLWLFALVPCLLPATPSQASEITPFGAFRTGGEFNETASDNTLDIDNTGTFGIILGMPYERDKTLEFFYSHQHSSLVEKSGAGVNTLFDLDIDYFQFGGTHMFNTTPELQPFVSGGLGFSWFSPGLDGLDSEIQPALGIGGGVKWKLTERFGLRFEVRGTGTFFGKGSSIFCSNGQCTANLRGELLFQADFLIGANFNY
jgi:hypothetical protein